MRAKVNLSIAGKGVSEVPALGIDVATADAGRAERNRCWREENRDALDRYAGEIEREGLKLARYRTF